MANSGEYKSVIGLKDLYYAAVTTDTTSAYTAGSTYSLAPAASATTAPTVNTVTQYADDAAYDVISSKGEVVIEMEVTAVPPEIIATLTGENWDSSTGRVYDNGGTPGYFALGFRSLKSNGSYRYYWYLKGRFEAISEEFATKGDTPEPKLQKLRYTAVKTSYLSFTLAGAVTDGVTRVYGDSDATGFVATGWFTQVQTPAVSAGGALSLSSSSPVDGVTGVVVSVNLTLTFSNALKSGAVDRVVLVKADGTAVAGAVTINAANTIITFNPTDSMAASTVHILTYNVEDIYGQKLSGAINFTTA